MSVDRKMKREALRKKLKEQGIQKPNKKMKEFWKDFKAKGKI